MQHVIKMVYVRMITLGHDKFYNEIINNMSRDDGWFYYDLSGNYIPYIEIMNMFTKYKYSAQ